MEELYQRRNLAKQQIRTVSNKTARMDLAKMMGTVDQALAAADQASVECRRLRKETLLYKEKVQKAETLITNLEQHLTFAALLNG